MWSGRVIGISKGTRADFEQHLIRCTVFYWIGGSPGMSSYLFYYLHEQMFLLKDYIERGKILFVGVGEGASIVGAAHHKEITMNLLPRVIEISDDTERKQAEAMVLHPHIMVLASNWTIKSIVVRVGESAAHMPTPQRRGPDPICENGVHRSGNVAVVSTHAASTRLPLASAPIPDVSVSAPENQRVTAGSEHYEHSICPFDEDHEYHMWKPKGTIAQQYVIYFPSTVETGKDATPLDTRLFQGKEVVLCPIVHNCRPKAQWRQEIPAWITTWILHLRERHGDVKWSLVGFSRGAAWGLKISSEIDGFDYVLLVAPYLTPSIRDGEGQGIAERLRPLYDRQALRIVYGMQDTWYPKREEAVNTVIWSIMDRSQLTQYENCNHNDSKAKALKEFWPRVVVH